MRERKIENYDANKLEKERSQIGVKDIRSDSASFNNDLYLRKLVFISEYDHKVSIFSKTLIFLLIPVFAGLFFLVFYRKLKYYGASLILATHFLAFNLLFYVMLYISTLPWKWFHNRTFNAIPFRLVETGLYNNWMSPFSNAVFGIYQGFEALHVMAWGVWLFITFKRLFRLSWLQNLFASYLIARCSYLIIFCLYKKLIIALTIWSM